MAEEGPPLSFSMTERRVSNDVGYKREGVALTTGEVRAQVPAFAESYDGYVPTVLSECAAVAEDYVCLAVNTQTERRRAVISGMCKTD